MNKSHPLVDYGKIQNKKTKMKLHQKIRQNKYSKKVIF